MMSRHLLTGDTGELEYLAHLIDTHHYIGFDTETNGLNYFDNHRIVGFCFAFCNQETEWFDQAEIESYYVPIRHLKDKHLNCDGKKLFRLIDRHLKQKELCGYNIKFDINMCRADRLYLGQCAYQDSQLMYSMLKGRKILSTTTLSATAKAMLGESKDDSHIDKTRMAYYSPMEVADYGANDARLSLMLYFKMYPMLHRFKLDYSYNNIERRVLPCNADMEWNAVKVEPSIIEKAQKHYQKEYFEMMNLLNDRCGFQINLNTNLDRAFEAIGVRPMDSYDKDHMSRKSKSKTLTDMQRKLIKIMIEAKKIRSLLDKYLNKYNELLDSNGMMRYQLHSYLNRHGGTKTGRYSSTAYGTRKETLGCNIQQVEKGILRKAFIPTNPYNKWVSVDADQQEFRIFAGKSGNKAVEKSYAENPEQSFHRMTHGRMTDEFEVFIEYQGMKNFNFMVMYGGGKKKAMSMLQCNEDKATKIMRAYDRMIPEAKKMRFSLSEIAERRGYIRTISGRIVRVDKPYAAMNAYIQGSGADDTKTRIIQLYDANIPGIIIHFTVHDELDFELPREGIKEMLAHRVSQVLNGGQEEGIYKGIKVPLRWGISHGRSWGDAK